jgi:bifunctional DNA-binding transcriptional regulator/antitoxin component of YhaV-PrlF toxin-antitoxin module
MIIQQNAKGQYTVTIPKPLVEGMNWRKGQELAVEIVERGKILLREKP